VKRGIFLVVLIGGLGTLALLGLRRVAERATAPATSPASGESRASASVDLDTAASDTAPAPPRSAGASEDLVRAVPAPAAGDVPAGDEGPPPHVSVRGRLLDERGGAAAGPRTSVSARDEVGASREAELPEAGRYEIHALAPGRWRIEADSHGFEPAHADVFLPDERATVEIDLVLRSLPVVRVVLLTPDGKSFTPAKRGLFLPRVFATREPLAGAAPTDLSLYAQCGTLAQREPADLERRNLGLLELTCDPPIWVSLVLAGRVLGAERVDPGVEEVVFVLDPAEHLRLFSDVRVRVVDLATGSPLTGVLAHFKAKPFHAWMNVTDDSGELEYENVISGPAALSLSRVGYAPREVEFDVPGGERFDLGDVAMDPGGKGKLRLSIAAPEGTPRAFVSWARSGTDPTTMWSTATWERGGVLELELGGGRWIVWAEGTEGERSLGSRDLEVAIDGGIAQETLPLEPLARLVLEPAEGERKVTILDPQVPGSLRRTYVIVDKILGVDLVPGRYELVVRGGNEEERRVPVEVGPAGARVRLE
jgi:hypothetical protein